MCAPPQLLVAVVPPLEPFVLPELAELFEPAVVEPIVDAPLLVPLPAVAPLDPFVLPPLLPVLLAVELEVELALLLEL
jgi:hypothetical protein